MRGIDAWYPAFGMHGIELLYPEPMGRVRVW